MNEIPQISRLKRVRLKILQVHSMDKLKALIENHLADWCGVDSVSVQEKIRAKKGIFQCSLPGLSPHLLIFKKARGFSLEEKKFLRQIGQTISMNLKRIHTYNQLQLLKKQWKSTFNAIEKPICLTDGDFNILSTNQSFLKQTGRSKAELYKKNCFLMFFGMSLDREETARLFKSKILKSLPQKNCVFEIHLQSFVKEKKDGAIRLVIFTDMTKKIKMEKELAHLQDSAQMGIIASSIAHELNNPLAGMQALLELAQAEKDGSGEIGEMLLAVRRCQNIIFQLLKSRSIPDLLQISKDKSLEITP